MKTKVSKAMVKTLNKELKNRDFTNIEKFVYDDTLDYNMYYHFVDYNPYEHENDYDIEDNRFKVITIMYKPECYSVNRYITTNDLIDAARHANRDYTSFINEIFNMYEI